MRPAACPRLFEVEAMRDGRLAGAERVSFVRHTTSCAICRREVEALDALGAALRAGGGDRADELHALRERTRLVAAFDRALVAPRRRSGARRWAPLAVTAAAMIAAAIFFARPRPLPTVEPGPVVVQAEAGAVWSRHLEQGRAKIVLVSGELRIRVDHARGATALVVALPDGELEDTGTIFTVSAADGRTTRVAVEEGSVSLRIRGLPPLRFGRGETWVPAPPAPPSAPERARTTSPPRPAPPRRVSAARAVATPDEADPALEFRAAVAVLDAGAHREAAAAFARFLAKHPRDPRAEDAAYLRVIALQRAGADEETKRAAEAYLRLYPAGFRHGEVEKLSR